MSADRAYELRSLVNLLQVHNQGDDLADLDRDLAKAISVITERIGAHGGSHAAELTITLKLTGDHKGFDVTVSGKVKLPARPVTKDRYFATEAGDGLTLKNPNKGTMFEGADLGRARFPIA